MKSFKKYAKITLAVLIFIAIIFFTYYYFNVVKKTGEEVILVEMNLPNETQNIKFAIEKVKRETLNDKDVLLLKGWVFKQNSKEAKRKLYLVLKSVKKTLIFSVTKANLARPDVTKYFHMDGNTNNHGFELTVPGSLLNEDTYQIGFIIEDETGKNFIMTVMVLRPSDATVTQNKPKLHDIKFISSKVSLTQKKPTSILNSNVESVHKSDTNITIKGWGFLQGMNSEFLKSYILLKKNETVIAFSVETQGRPDVTTYFKKSGLNFDSSGFFAKIPVTLLEKGHYRIGLYIVRGNQTGLSYSDKFIDIAK
ncbi:MAG: hypothetical protein NTX61_13050 [Bacteroidetes bacterium]|nr:hypothetical protein [Bacteroidota bacterium]